MIRYLWFAAFGLMIICASCKLEGDCLYQQEIPVTMVEMPDSIPVDSTFTLYFTCYIGNDCGTYLSTNMSELYDTVYVHAYAEFKGCDCAADAHTQDKTLELSLLKANNYYFKFWYYNDSLDTSTVLTVPINVYDSIPNY